MSKGSSGGPARGLKGRHPGWLMPSAAGFVVVPGGREIVRRIYELSLQGFGAQAIADRLNAENKKSFAKDPGSWTRVYVEKILRSRTVLGERVAPNGRIIAGYYPTIIESELFKAVEKRRRRGVKEGGALPRGRHSGKAPQNIVAGVARCSSCGGVMTQVPSAAPGLGYLMCSKARRGQRCENKKAVRIGDVEAALFAAQDTLKAAAGFERDEDQSAERQALHDEMGRALQELDDVREEFERRERELHQKLAEIGGRLADTERETLGPARTMRLCTSLDRLRAHRHGSRRPMKSKSARPVGGVAVRRRGDLTEAEFPPGYKLRKQDMAIQGEGEDPDAIARVNATLRETVESVIVDSVRGELRVHWQHDPEAKPLVLPFPSRKDK